MSFEVNAGRGRGAHPYLVQTGMVFRLLSLKNRVYKFTIYRLQQGVFLDRNPLKEFTWYQQCEMVRLQALVFWMAKCAIFALKRVRV